jgi:hypothetical protein
MRLYSPESLERVVVDNQNVAEHLRMGLVPSVTEILGIINEGEHLTRWMIKQSLHYYEQTGDLNIALEYRNTQSADFGTVCHALAEQHLTGIECEEEYTPLHVKTVLPFTKWADANIDSLVFTEKFFADGELGYGGTADMLVKLKDGRQVLADLKFKKHSKAYPMKPSTNYKYQLSAYRNHFKKEFGDMDTMNFLCSSPFGVIKTPTLIIFDYKNRDWTEGFECAKKLWWEKYGEETAAEVGEVIR